MDINMPGINGVETLEEIKRKKPNLGAIIMTAYDIDEIVKEELLKKGAYTLL